MKQFATLRTGELVPVHIFRRTHTTLGNLVHVLFTRIAASQGMSVRNVRAYLAVITGRADMVEVFGRRMPVAWSTGLGAMNTTEFGAFVVDALEAIRDEVLPRLALTDRAEVMLLMDKVANELDASSRT